MCDHHLEDDPDGLVCTRKDPHTTGHVYKNGHGSELNDRHGEQGHG